VNYRHVISEAFTAAKVDKILWTVSLVSWLKIADVSGIIIRVDMTSGPDYGDKWPQKRR
jgi:hypothetical protein